jgi:hypothetical protein
MLVFAFMLGAVCVCTNGLYAQAPKPATTTPATTPAKPANGQIQFVDQAAAAAQLQQMEDDNFEPKVIVIQLNPALKPDRFNCFDARFDAYPFTLTLTNRDVLNRLDEIGLTEEVIESEGCFVPLAKLVFKDFTYIISPNCANSQKYKNTSPYVTSREMVENDFIYTESVVRFLDKIQNTYFRKELQEVYNRMAPPPISALGTVTKVDNAALQSSINEVSPEEQQEGTASAEEANVEAPTITDPAVAEAVPGLISDEVPTDDSIFNIEETLETPANTGNKSQPAQQQPRR